VVSDQPTNILGLMHGLSFSQASLWRRQLELDRNAAKTSEGDQRLRREDYVVISLREIETR
jgi:hypothetical protein